MQTAFVSLFYIFINMNDETVKRIKFFSCCWLVANNALTNFCTNF